LSYYFDTFVTPFSPIGYWAVGDVASGSLPDTSGNGRSATVSGSVTTAGTAPRWLTAGTFTPGNTASTASFTYSTPSQFSAECWFSTSATGNEALLIDGGSYTGHSNQNWSVAIYTDNKVYFDWNSTGAYHRISAAVPGGLTANTWHHVVALYDGSHQILYIDGTAVATSATITDTWTWVTPKVRFAASNLEFVIGNISYAVSLAGAGFYPSAFTPTQVADRYQGYELVTTTDNATWNVCDTIPVTAPSSWKSLTLVPKSSSASWNSDATVTKTAQSSWKTRTAVSTSVRTTWVSHNVTPYTQNLCPNPSFESTVTVTDSDGGTSTEPQGNLTGYTALPGTTLAYTSQDAMAGQYSMLVTTDGHAAGEGFVGPMVEFDPVDEYCSMQVSMTGETGSLMVSALTPAVGGNPMAVLGQVTVTLSPGWQTVALDGLGLAQGEQAYLVVWTNSAQALTFMVDCVQYEPESPHHDYVESTRFFQNYFTASGGTVVEGTAELITPGLIRVMTPNPGGITSGGSVSLVMATPVAAFDDFGMWELTDPDPAMTYVGWNTANQSTGHSNYARNWGIFYPPLDYPVSDGTLLWKRAAFMVPGFQYLTVPAGVSQNLTAVQAEMLPLFDIIDSAPAPSAWDTPRALHVRVRPTRLNHSPNPSFDNGTTGWTALGAATLSQDATVQYGILGSSGKVTCTGPGDAVQLAVPQLIAGDIYTCSVYVLPESGHIVDLQIQAGGTSGGISGVPGSVLPQTNKDGTEAWVRSSVTFTATASTMSLVFAPVTDGTYPVTFALDDNLIEAGDLIGNYFDGNGGNPDYYWEGGTGVSRSYYYEGYNAGQQVISDVLDRHVPIEITAADPVYMQPPTQ